MHRKPYYLDYERVSHHESMIGDRARTDSFGRAIKKLVKKGAVVADLGSGTGILSIFASRAGARKVYGIERTGIINVAKRIAKDTHISNIDFIGADSQSVRLSEKCDVLVSECIGYFGLQENMITDVIKFKRWLKDTGVIIPENISLFIVPISESAPYSQIDFWEKVSRFYKIKFSSMKKISVNSTYRHKFKKSSQISMPQKLYEIDLMTAKGINLEKKVKFRISRSSSLYGFCGYFISKLCPDVVIDTSPGNKTHWKQEYFPCAEPIKVNRDETVEFSIKAVAHKGFVDWLWKIQAGNHEESHSTLRGTRLKER